MLRRLILISTLALLLGAAPAFAHGCRLNTQMAVGTATSSRQNHGCAITNGAHDSLVVSCSGRSKATLAYTFTSSTPVQGKAMGWPYVYGHAHWGSSTTVSGRTIRLTVTVSGGTVTIGSVCVSYYAEWSGH